MHLHLPREAGYMSGSADVWCRVRAALHWHQEAAGCNSSSCCKSMRRAGACVSWGAGISHQAASDIHSGGPSQAWPQSGWRPNISCHYDMPTAGTSWAFMHVMQHSILGPSTTCCSSLLCLPVPLRSRWQVVRMMPWGVGAPSPPCCLLPHALRLSRCWSGRSAVRLTRRTTYWWVHVTCAS
jgi:hypothetical protein